MPSAAPQIDVAGVTALVQHVAASVVMPRFRALADGEVFAKGVGDLVTIADQQAESMLTAELPAYAPGVPVVGEEAAAADPTLLDGLDALDTWWVVDPVDGTANFVDGSPDFGVMVALVHRGEAVAAWIWQPVHDVMLVAERGSGAYRNDERLGSAATPVTAAAAATGWVFAAHLPSEVRGRVLPRRAAFADVRRGPRAAAVAYGRLAAGEVDFALYWRTAPWDHLPGALIVREAGGASRRPDGTDYRAGDGGAGLVLTSRAESWSVVRDALLPEEAT